MLNLFRVIILLSFVLCDSTYSLATTLLEVNWDVGTTCNATNINSGALTNADSADCTHNMGIGTGGPGDRNYLIFYLPSGDYTSNIIHNPSSFGLNSTVYVRFWFRKHMNGGGGAHFVWLNDEYSNYGSCIMRSYDASTFSILPDYSYNDVYYYNGDFSFNTWYLIEYKYTNAGSGSYNASMQVKIDGVEVTSSFISDSSSRTLTQDNGSLRISQLNYWYASSYQQVATGQYLDIAGLKITDGPDWIGGDSGGDTTAPTVSITTSDPSSITADSLSVTGTASDAVWGDGSVCKWRIGSAPDASNGTACTGTTSWTCSTSGYTRGANTLYVGCGDAVPNWGAGDSITVNFSPTAGGLTAVSGVTIR